MLRCFTSLKLMSRVVLRSAAEDMSQMTASKTAI